MSNIRVAFAGVSRLCEEILRAALARRTDVEVVSPWTRLQAVVAPRGVEARECLIVELHEGSLPSSLRHLLAAAPGLRIIGVSADARTVTIFGLHERRTAVVECSADELCSLIDHV